jgi:thioester reductase-like protein
MGISELEYKQLAQSIDTVIHTAALVKHYGDYRDFEEINVNGVKEVVEFSNNKNLFHISTTSVSGNCGISTLKNIHFTEGHFDIGQTFNDNYYIKSKFEAEKVIRNEMKNGLKVSIIRIGNLTGRYTDGHFQINISDNKFYNILKSIVKIKSIPKSMLHQKLEFTPVDKCSEAIVKIIQRNESLGRTFHVMNDNYISIKSFIKRLRRYGYKIKSLNDDSFYTNLRTISSDLTQRQVLFGLITDLQNGRLNYNSSIIIDSKFSISFLRLLEFKWPAINRKYFFKIIKHIEGVNFFRK